MARWRFLLSRAAFDNVDYFFYLSSSRTPPVVLRTRAHVRTFSAFSVARKFSFFRCIYPGSGCFCRLSRPRTTLLHHIFFRLSLSSPPPSRPNPPALLLSPSTHFYATAFARSVLCLPCRRPSGWCGWCLCSRYLFFCAALSTVWPAVGRILSLL